MQYTHTVWILSVAELSHLDFNSWFLEPSLPLLTPGPDPWPSQGSVDSNTGGTGVSVSHLLEDCRSQPVAGETT